MTVGRVRSKFDRYDEAAKRGVLTRQFGAERFRVLVVARSMRRLISLHRAAEQAGAQNVWLTTEEALGDNPILDDVWLRAGKGGQFALLRRDQVFERVAAEGDETWRVPPSQNNHNERGRHA
jgi:hypothetical protein